MTQAMANANRPGTAGVVRHEVSLRGLGAGGCGNASTTWRASLTFQYVARYVPYNSRIGMLPFGFVHDIRESFFLIPGWPGQRGIARRNGAMLKFLKSFVRDERGVSAIEYTLLATIAILALVGLGTNYRTAIGNLFSNLYSIVSRN